LIFNKILLPDIEDELPSLDVASIREPNNYYAGEYGVLKSMRNARVLELRRFTSYVSEPRPKFIFNLCFMPSS
jgi:hypothetical protein